MICSLAVAGAGSGIGSGTGSGATGISGSISGSGAATVSGAVMDSVSGLSCRSAGVGLAEAGGVAAGAAGGALGISTGALAAARISSMEKRRVSRERNLWTSAGSSLEMKGGAVIRDRSGCGGAPTTGGAWDSNCLNSNSLTVNLPALFVGAGVAVCPAAGVLFWDLVFVAALFLATVFLAALFFFFVPDFAAVDLIRLSLPMRFPFCRI